MLCGYGCGQEALYPPKKRMKKWCCSKNFAQCPVMKEKMNEKKRGRTWDQINGKEKAEERRKKQTIRMTGKNNPMFGVDPWNKNKTNIYSEEILEKIKSPRTTKGKTYEEIYGEETTKKLKIQRSKHFSKIRKGVKPWNKNKTNIYSKEVLLKLKKPRIWTFKGLQKHHPEFFKIEKPRESNGKIKVKCKFCNIWFTPTKSQLHERLRCIKNKFKNINSFFYCSQECKDNCEEFNRKVNPLELKKFKRYSSLVYKYTYQSVKKYNIKNIDLRGRKFGFDLDHKYSIYNGFLNQIDAKIIGHYLNLHIISSTENRKKRTNCSVTIDTLLENINNFKQEVNNEIT